MQFNIYSKNDITTVFNTEGRVIGVVERKAADRFDVAVVESDGALVTLDTPYLVWSNAVEAVYKHATGALSA